MADARTPLGYPPAPRADTVDRYFGHAVADPFRPLEAIDSAETRAWLAAQRAVTDAYFAALPQRDALRTRARRIADFERTGIPMHENGTYVVARNSGLQNQAVLYASHGEAGDPWILLDPNALSDRGTVALGAAALSPDGTLLAYALQTSGSDWQTWRVRDVARAIDLPDRLAWAKFSSAAWLPDGSGFYYSRYDAPRDAEKLDIVGEHQKVAFHRIGTSQTDDVVVYERPDEPKMYLSGDVTEDGRYLILDETRGGVKNGIVVRDLSEPALPAVRLFAPDQASYRIVASDGSRFYIHTTDGAPNGRVVALDIATPAELREIIAQTSEALESVTSCGGRFFATYLRDARSHVALFDRTGTLLREVSLPGIGTAAGFAGRETDEHTYYAFSTFVAPTTIYRYDLGRGHTTPYAVPQSTFESSAYVTEQRFATSADGTRVPVFITRTKDAPLDGSARMILYGYGGFDINLTPGFAWSMAAWLETGGSYAIANLRGGGEYGQAWHEAGMREHKQNVFDDFIAVAETLVRGGYTSPGRLAISGGSNGGLLCGAVLTQRPELVRAVLCDVGVLDMLRYQHFTVGAGWIPEYGSADASEAEFRTLLKYSPLANVRPGAQYPATLISTGDHDDRVFPAHSFKFAAALQEAQAGDAPILLYLESDAGHGAGKPLAKSIEETANRFAFLLDVLD